MAPLQSSVLADFTVGTWLSEPNKHDLFGFVHELCKLIRENRPPHKVLYTKLTGDFLRYCLVGPFPHVCEPDEDRLEAIIKILSIGSGDLKEQKKWKINRLVAPMLDSILVRCVLRSKSFRKQMQTLEDTLVRKRKPIALKPSDDAEDSEETD
jgi:hypothetical protein